jgi:phage antirepressor YoqD-like protein
MSEFSHFWLIFAINSGNYGRLRLMKALAIEKKMTVREVAEVLGVSERTIQRHLKELRDEDSSDIDVAGIQNGPNGRITQYLTEKEVTDVKKRMLPTSQIVGSITDLEAAEMLLKSAEHFKARFEQEKRLRVEAEQKLAITGPKAKLADLAMQSKDVISMNDAAKILKLGYGNITLFKNLRKIGVLMADNVPYQEYISRGYFVVDESPILIGDHIHIKTVTKVTQKGVNWLSGKLPDSKMVVAVE